MHRYMNHVLEVASASEAAAYTVASVVHLTLPPAALFRPAVLLPALRHVIRTTLYRAPRPRDDEATVEESSHASQYSP
jgi:hypothetical protein